jgi:outer membrane lipoprotein SlyB
MRRMVLFVSLVVLQALIVDAVLAQESIFFPAKGQSQAQMEKDKFACYQWAKQQTGFDPMQAQPPVQAVPPVPQAPSGQRIRGAARGAAVGAAVGGIASNDAGKGAAAGAVAGTMAGGIRSRNQRRQQAQIQEQQVQQQATASDAGHSTYNRAYSVCMEGKGYTVK